MKKLVFFLLLIFIFQITTAMAIENSDSDIPLNMTVTSPPVKIPWASFEDPLTCSIPTLVFDSNIVITCKPLNNNTGQPITGTTVTCQAWNSMLDSIIQSASSSTEREGGIYNWTLSSSNISQNNCYWVNCSTTINGVTNGYASAICVVPEYSRTSEVNITIYDTLLRNFTYLWNQFDCSNQTTNEMCIRLAGWIAEAQEIKLEGEKTQDILVQISEGLSGLINNRILLLTLVVSITFIILLIVIYHNFKKAEEESVL